jgi:hypothetical protein
VSIATHAFASVNDAEQLGGGEASQVTNIVIEALPGWGTLTVVVEGSLDAATWVQLFGQNLNDGTKALIALTTAGQIVRLDVSGLTYVRARCSAFTSGSGALQWGSGTQAVRV